MNNVSLVGRLTRDPEVRYTDGGLSIARFSLAVDRRFKKEGQPDADFPNCVAFGKTAEFIEKWFHKGQRIGLVGRIQTGSYTKEDGTKVYTTDVVAENVEFVESKSSESGQGLPPEPSIADANDGWVNVPDDIDEELPFN
jgi:single-strand DNA-binding protein